MNEKDNLLQEGLAAFKAANYNGISLLPTGSGKGRLMIEIAKILNPKEILYLCNTTLARDKMIIDELYKWDAGYLIDRINRQCYQTVAKWENAYYPLLLGDEFDAALTPIYIKAITNNKFDHKILVSATLSDDKKRLAKKIAPIILEKTLQEAIDTNILNNIKFYIVNYDLSTIENGQYLTYNLQFKDLLNQFKTKTIEKRLDWIKINRKQFLSSLQSSANVTKWLLNNLKKTNEKVLIFTGLSSQADKVCVDSFHSNNSNIEAFTNFDAGIIKQLAVVDKVDRALNIPDIRHIIFDSVGSSITRMVQRLGRGMRLQAHEYLNAYLLVPHYIDNYGHRKPTIVEKWIRDAAKDLDLSTAKIINYK